MERDIEREVYRLERMDHEIERHQRVLDQARTESRQARGGLVTDALLIAALCYGLSIA